MGSYNYLEFVAQCQSCKASAEIVAQVHHGSSFEGDAEGRFHGRTYRPGERLRWWPPADPRFATWRDDSIGRIDPSGLAENEAEEICYAECRACHADVLVLVRVTDLVPQVIAVHGPDGPAGDDWGAGYAGGYYL